MTLKVVGWVLDVFFFIGRGREVFVREESLTSFVLEVIAFRGNIMCYQIRNAAGK